MKTLTWLPVKKAGTVLGKRTILPILTLLLGEKYLAEIIYNIYRKKVDSLILQWYKRISPFQIISNVSRKSLNPFDTLYTPIGFVSGCEYHNYIHPRIELLSSIRMIGHPDFMSFSDKNLQTKCHMYNITRRNRDIDMFSQMETLINLQTKRKSIVQKTKVFNRITEKYDQEQKDTYEENRYIFEKEMGDIPYDIPVFTWDSMDLIDYIYRDFVNLDNLWNCGYIVDKTDNIFCISSHINL